VRKDLLASITGKKKVVGYKLGSKWPAPVKFFENGPVGFVSVIQLWFRYYFKNHIAEQLSELVASDGMLQLGDAPTHGIGASGSDAYGAGEKIQANSEGNCVNATGKFRYMADRNLMDMPGSAVTSDKLFTEIAVLSLIAHSAKGGGSRFWGWRIDLAIASVSHRSHHVSGLTERIRRDVRHN
jgi:hypothetical protein